MVRTRLTREKSFTGLFLLTVFVNLYLVQLVCNLPHLMQRLTPAASASVHGHGADHEGHSHTHEASSSKHHGTEHAHHEDDHSKEDDCCVGQDYAPFIKASPTVELPSLVKASFIFIDSFCQAVLSLLHKSRIMAVLHAPPNSPVPKIPDIRIFLHSLII